MQDFLGSVRRSLVFRPSTDAGGGTIGGGGGIGERIGSYLRKSRVGLGALGLPHKLTPPLTAATEKEEKGEEPSFWWGKGELIGRGAFGHVYMGMNLNSGELLAVKFWLGQIMTQRQEPKLGSFSTNLNPYCDFDVPHMSNPKGQY